MTVVTRFAPSPTGYLHIGGARTALFCWLMARHHGGRFILRIEDTDQKRNTPTAARQVMQDLCWLGIDWDEGPDIDDPTGPGKGPNAPYSQSLRLDIYNKYLRQLIEAGKAYYCMDTPEEIEALRQQAQAEKRTFVYPRPQVYPDQAAVEKARADGRPVTVRFAVPTQEKIVVHDIVRGEVTFDAREISDFIIQKSDGFPTYHFACVVDDELMEVTHVIRGQEHLMNTPGHIALQQALGFRTPEYAHISVTVSEGGGKLSKRERAKTLLKTINERSDDIKLAELAAAGTLTMKQMTDFMEGSFAPDGPDITAMAEFLEIHLPEINVVDFFNSGYIPEAMVNFVALLGWNPGDNREIMPLEELIEAFDLHRLARTNSLFDRDKLKAFNTDHMRLVSPERLLEHFKNYLRAQDSPFAEFDDQALAYILKINEGAQTLEQIVNKCRFLIQKDSEIEFDPRAVKKVLSKDGCAEVLGQIRDVMAGVAPWDSETLHKTIEAFCEEKDLGMGKVAQPIRVAITGTMISPPIDASLKLLGRGRTLKRIDQAIEFVENL